MFILFCEKRLFSSLSFLECIIFWSFFFEFKIFFNYFKQLINFSHFSHLYIVEKELGDTYQLMGKDQQKNMSNFQTSQISNVNTLQHVAFRELKEKKTKQNKKHGKGNWSMNVAESLTSLKIWWAVQWPAGCGGALKFFFIPITSSICVRREVKSQMIDHFSIASLHLSKYEFQTDFLERRGYKDTKINK